MRNRPVHRRSGAALIAACSLFVAACGGAADEEATTPADAAPAPSADDGSSAAPGTTAATTPATTPATAPPTSAAAPGTTPATTTTTPATAPPTSAAAPPSTPPTTTPVPTDGNPALLRSVLRPAVERASVDASYAFVMGMQLDMSAQGLDITMGDADVPFATGTHDGARTYMRTEIGSWMASMLENLFANMFDGGGVPPDEAEQGAAMLGQMLAVFDGAVMETWADADEGVMVLDAAEFYSLLIGLGGLTGGELEPFQVLAEGPVLIRADELGDALGDMYGSLGISTGMTTPDQMVEMLTSATDLREIGPGQVGSHAVTVYAATVDLAAMYGSIELELADVLGPGAESDQVVQNLGDFVIDITVMIDDDSLLRRVEVDLDMTDLLADIDPQAADQFGTYTISTWQEFDRYGESYPYDPPAATDITDLYAGLFAQTVI